MFTNFPGSHLVEDYHKWKKAKKDAGVNNPLAKVFKLVFVIAVTMTLWLLPTTAFGIEGLTVVEQRVIGVFVFATLMWVLEAIPAWSTSLIVVGLLLFMTSDSAFKALNTGYTPEQLGTILKYQDILHCFADPIIMLFIGGFMLAIAATKYGLDAKIAKVLLKPFGTQSRFVMLGFIVVTGLFSAFISNTATAAMMLAFLAPVLKALPADGKGKIGLALSIPVAANIGGMATPMKAIHSPKPIPRPMGSRYFNTIPLGGVPMGVAIPPMLAATGIERARPILPLPSAGRAFNTGAKKASIIAAVAVLLMKAEKRPVTTMKPRSTKRDCVPKGLSNTLAILASRPYLVAAIASMKPPMKSMMMGSAKQWRMS